MKKGRFLCRPFCFYLLTTKDFKYIMYLYAFARMQQISEFETFLTKNKTKGEIL